ncbi:MAG: hypothetical protein PHW96_00495 [Candidatus Nanoarchaeia archaeon]|nr:hypothetical protein [Candidatus Nanoarchaeia archaeon]
MDNTNSIVDRYPRLGGISNSELESIIPSVHEFIASCGADKPTKADVVGFLNNIGFERASADDVFRFINDRKSLEIDENSLVSISEEYILKKNFEADIELKEVVYLLKEILADKKFTFERTLFELRKRGRDVPKSKECLNYLIENGFREGNIYVWLEENKYRYLELHGESLKDNKILIF